MSTDSVWSLERSRLAESLARWRAQNTSPQDRRFVNEFLMDLVKDPFECGQEDDKTGVFTGRAGSNIIIVYVPDLEHRSIAVADIAYAEH